MPHGLMAPQLTHWEPSAWEVGADWKPVVGRFFDSAAGKGLGNFVRSRIAGGATVFPAQPLRALALTPLAAVKVVILGQDPYHGAGQAQGLAFSVEEGVRIPPSLANIRFEIERERAAGELDERPVAGSHVGSDLRPWARQGVLLLNTCLTVEQGLPGSHARHGWEALTDAILQAVNQNPGPVVYMLWGAHAQSRRPATGTEPAGAARAHLLANHPSPLSARRKPLPFIGCGHFAQANDFLRRHAAVPVDWR